MRKKFFQTTFHITSDVIALASCVAGVVWIANKFRDTPDSILEAQKAEVQRVAEKLNAQQNRQSTNLSR